MLKRLTIKNYKCFESFEFDFDPDDRALLLLGKNGAGKTSLADALEIFQKIGRGVGQVGCLLSPSQRWNKNTPVEFEISVVLNGVSYEYGFSLEFPKHYRELRIVSEELKCDAKPIYRREGAEIFFGEKRQTSALSYDWHVLFLPTFQDKLSPERVDVFRSWLGHILILSPEPKDFKDDSTEPVGWPSRDCTDCVSWLTHILTTRPKAYSEIETYLKNIWEDFYTIINEQVGSETKRLRLEFRDSDSKHETEFSPILSMLSDGEKCLFLSAVVRAAHEAAQQSILCFWDEPDSFLSLSETGHFIQAMRGVFSKRGQLIVTSHNTEVINAFTESTTWVMGRDNHLSPVKPPKRVSDLRGSDVLPRKANFIHALISGEIRV